MSNHDDEINKLTAERDELAATLEKTKGEFLTTESLQATVQTLMPLTYLLKHIRSEPATSTVEEYDDTRGKTHCLLIKYAGVIVHEADDAAEKKNAVLRLLMHVDEFLFSGNPHEEGHEVELEGLVGFAQVRSDESPPIEHLGYPRIDMYEPIDREAFYDRYERNREKKALRLFTPMHAMPIHEGDLPVSGPTYAIGAEALVWRQLLPVTYILLAPMREGLVMYPTDMLRGERTVQPKHDRSRTRHRGVVVMYGGLELHDPEAVFGLEGVS